MASDVGRHLVVALALLCVGGLFAGSPTASCHGSSGLTGELQPYRVKAGDSLIEVARKFDLGFNALVAANPGIDPWVPPPGTLITLPTARILPELRQRPGLVINIPEFRLYYFPKSPDAAVLTFPLGIGEQGRDTPVGRYTVVEKIVRPVWRVPKSIRSEYRNLPRLVPPGPDNPLGSHALRLSRNDLLIHGTNRPWGIGRRSSHGCLRLYPEDIVKLYQVVARGTRVTVVNQPVKACTREGRVILEAHPQPTSGSNTVGQALQLLADRHLLTRVDFAKVIRVMDEMKGIPEDVTLAP